MQHLTGISTMGLPRPFSNRASECLDAQSQLQNAKGGGIKLRGSYEPSVSVYSAAMLNSTCAHTALPIKIPLRAKLCLHLWMNHIVFIAFISIEDKFNLIKQIKQKSEWPSVTIRVSCSYQVTWIIPQHSIIQKSFKNAYSLTKHFHI